MCASPLTTGTPLMVMVPSGPLMAVTVTVPVLSAVVSIANRSVSTAYAGQVPMPVPVISTSWPDGGSAEPAEARPTARAPAVREQTVRTGSRRRMQAC